jgi:hypothetical protein
VDTGRHTIEEMGMVINHGFHILRGGYETAHTRMDVVYGVAVDVDITFRVRPFDARQLKVTNGDAVAEFILQDVLVNQIALVLTIRHENDEVSKARAIMLIHHRCHMYQVQTDKL